MYAAFRNGKIAQELTRDEALSIFYEKNLDNFLLRLNSLKYQIILFYCLLRSLISHNNVRSVITARNLTAVKSDG